MIDLDEHIRSWTDHLLVAQNPSEASKAELELERLWELKRKNLNSRTSFVKTSTGKISRKPQVFIIHGHDIEMKEQVKHFISQLGLNHIVLQELANHSRTIIEKLEQEAIATDFAIALFSPDDELNDGTRRARQNVVFELGYFAGLLGRKRLCILKRGDLELPGDLHGILTCQFEDKNNWEMALARELFGT